ncbi:pantoate--beta-alanine ligase [Helicobacter didelphidarum]|uniref:Pantothenate synthetase n=1 Tax=Helicobacter didelphidarum TaxID=2040648 RepID=A0A3D8IPH1_9HELI|nr:pantoate--beta-alanine ligase [Helicobacter didelphidarum]RDU67158.1 pantoate--beta-alanine ligase [Helicobacter didelphidarum]
MFLHKKRDSEISKSCHIIESNNEALSLLNKAQQPSPTIGFTPTMGALHNGHKSLITANVAQNHISIVSIFVNPTQFAPTEDLDKYPRTIEKDIELCGNNDVDILFIPTNETIYQENDEITLNPPKKMGYILEGYYRPTHFAGVLQVVLKLFNLIMPTHAYFGQKDAQQLLIIQKMVQHLCLPIKIIGMPIVRDSDNLALSSRNVYLNTQERKKALAIPTTIFHLQTRIVNDGMRNRKILKQEAKEILKDLEIDYMDFYTYDLQFAKEARECIFLLAIRMGAIRLLDNLWIQ